MIVHVIRVQGMCHVNRYKETPLNYYLKQLIIRDGNASNMTEEQARAKSDPISS